LVAGDAPVFLEIKGFKEIFFHVFREGTKVRVEFGAEQVQLFYSIYTNYIDKKLGYHCS
jgi:hypothetical protein